MKIASNKVKDIARYFREELKNNYDGNELETIIRYCFEEFLNVSNFDIHRHENDTVTESELLKFNFAVKDLKNQKPLQYIFGRADFYGLKFLVNENVLIPRPETEELVDLIINDLQNIGGTPDIIDIGTGSGCIPIALKKHLSKAQISAVDISAKALQLAKKNSEINMVDISFIEDDILSPSEKLLEKKFDVIVSNPPYIKISEKNTMEANVLNFEPHLALFVTDEDALLFYRKIADFALKTLRSDGIIYFEINSSLDSETKQLLESKGFRNVELIKDMSNKNRILRGTL